MTEEAARTELSRTIIEKGGAAFRQSDSRIAEPRRCQCGYRFPVSGYPFSLRRKENLCQWDITMIFLSGWWNQADFTSSGKPLRRGSRRV